MFLNIVRSLGIGLGGGALSVAITVVALGALAPRHDPIGAGILGFFFLVWASMILTAAFMDSRLMERLVLSRTFPVGMFIGSGVLFLIIAEPSGGQLAYYSTVLGSAISASITAVLTPRLVT